jgi:hypothetical protein
MLRQAHATSGRVTHALLTMHYDHRNRPRDSCIATLRPERARRASPAKALCEQRLADRQSCSQAPRDIQAYAFTVQPFEEPAWLEFEISSEGVTDAPVVRTALALSLELPDASALEILDRAMRAHDGEDLEFQFECELQPPHPFTELLRRAFAPDLDRMELLSATEQLTERLDEPADPQMRSWIDSIACEWDRAILLFAQRYGIWGPRLM